MGRVRVILAAILILLAYGSGGLRALHALNHGFGPPAATAGATGVDDRVACGARHRCPRSRGEPREHCLAESVGSRAASTTACHSDGETTPDDHHHPADGHGLCGLCEMFATAAPLVIAGQVAAPAMIRVGTASVRQEQVVVAAGREETRARGPPQA